ncbi:hypothetical protein GMOD_00009101 [Pyrenophora seminiperda CCB06]|uniref:Uncharacterized protein n=1 Tax=Pyrenophora seminiperda CCB06 TaxID=1302712 RepID=A0A3M7MFP7_9PLEO|nr:hypothetical protein GMOD_00009101 [Pyrenophora seminiperda CCB06]
MREAMSRAGRRFHPIMKPSAHMHISLTEYLTTITLPPYPTNLCKHSACCRTLGYFPRKRSAPQCETHSTYTLTTPTKTTYKVGDGCTVAHTWQPTQRSSMAVEFNFRSM